MVGSDHHSYPCLLEAKAQTTGAAEEVRREEDIRTLPSDAFAEVGQLRFGRTVVIVGLKPDKWPTHEFHAWATALHG
jgi:hypothetical protein